MGFNSAFKVLIPSNMQPSATECIFRYLLIFGDDRITVTSKCATKNIENYLIFFISSPVCPQNFSFRALSLYFLFHMSYNSSYLRTSSINFSSISEDKNRQHSLQANTRSVVEET